VLLEPRCRDLLLLSREVGKPKCASKSPRRIDGQAERAPTKARRSQCERCTHGRLSNATTTNANDHAMIREPTFADWTLPERTLPERTLPERTLPERTLPEWTLPEWTLPERRFRRGGGDIAGWWHWR